MSSLYLCRDCSAAFHSLDDLQTHERVEHLEHVEHRNEIEETIPMIKIEDVECLSDTDSMKTPYSESFLDKSSTSEKIGRYECDDCHETFAVKRELATHMRIHSGEQPHSCTQCGKEFGTRQLLKKHWMWHTGERSHVCPHCNKAFFQKGHLTQHLMIHSGGRPHECPQCHKTFIFKFDLNRHMKIHQERGYSCQQCGRSFLKQIMLDEHHLKCKGKPSSPIRSLLTPTMKAGLENAFASKPSPETLLLSPETITKMAQKLLLQQQQQQENQRNVLNTLLVKQENILNNNNNNNDVHILNGNGNMFEIPAPPTLPPLGLSCMLCKTSFSSQSAFTIHMYMYHISTPSLSVDSSSNLLSSQSEPSSDVDPATDTSCASSPQKVSPLTLESSSCLEQSSVSPSSSSGASPQPTVSESSSSSSCKDCLGSWRRVHDLEQQMLKKEEEFESYKQMTKQLVANMSNILTTSSPDNLFLMNMANAFSQIKNPL